MAASDSGGKDGRRSYAWARHLEASEVTHDQLSPKARAGLGYALELATDAKQRSLEPRRHEGLAPLTIEEIAADVELPVATVRARIVQARHQLFGDLTDAAIHKRCQRIRTRPRQRTCAQAGCGELLPLAAAGNRRYCRFHGSSGERARRHRLARRPVAAAIPFLELQRSWEEHAAEAAAFARSRLCRCGCGKELASKRVTTRYYSRACRQRVYRRHRRH